MTQLPIVIDTPAILDVAVAQENFPLVQDELNLLTTARDLFDAGFPAHSLLDLWNAAVHNLRRRVEAYSVELFSSIVRSEPGRKTYRQDGDTIQDRWEGVDDLVLVKGASQLGILSRKAAKCLETINWMRNHASSAHPTLEQVQASDVAALALILQENLFSQQLPDPGHSVVGLFEPIKNSPLTDDQLDTLRDQIRASRPPDIRTCFGFLMEKVIMGEEPSYTNSVHLYPLAWDLSSEQLRASAGAQYHTLFIDRDSDSSNDKGGAERLLNVIVTVGGVQYIPDAARAKLFRRAARNLATAKDTSYGWGEEIVAANTFVQFGTCIPSIAFEEVYQEILSVWCGNYWGDSGAQAVLEPFVATLGTRDVRKVAQMFVHNQRVQAELYNSKPKAKALALLTRLRNMVTIAAHQAEVDTAINAVQSL